MNFKTKTLLQLKNICKKNNIKNYSSLNKEELIKYLTKNLSKMKGGNEIILDRSTLLDILNCTEEDLINLTEIELYNNEIMKIEKGTFRKLYNLKTLILSNNILTEIEEDNFSDLINLNVLMLNDNNITLIKDSSFKNLINLTEIELSNNEIMKIEKGIFSKLYNLNALNLSYNKLIEIEEDNFNDLINLNILMLNNNNITLIKDSSFKNLVNLEYLMLYSNKIEVIKKNIFSTLINLNDLYLSDNKIKEIEFSSFGKLTKLENLFLDENELVLEIPENFNKLKDKDKFSTINLSKFINLFTFIGLNNIKCIELDFSENLNKNSKEKLNTVIINNIKKINETNIINQYFDLYHNINEIYYNNKLQNDKNIFSGFRDYLIDKTIPIFKKILHFNQNINNSMNNFINNQIRPNVIQNINNERSIKEYKILLSNKEIPYNFKKNNTYKKLYNESKLIKSMISNENNNKNNVHLPKMSIDNMNKIENYLNNTNIFMNEELNQDNLFRLFIIANYLDMDNLLNIIFHKIFNLIKDYNKEQLIKFFHLKKVNN